MNQTRTANSERQGKISLGFKVSLKGCEPSDEKTAVVQNFPSPKSPKEVKQFVGLAGYFRRFIKDFASIASPLNELLKKNRVFKWTDECEKAFQLLKDKLVSAPILAFPNFDLPFELHCDASGVAVGSALMQTQLDGTERVIAYAGRTLQKAERNYTVTELETLAVVVAVRHFSPYLMDKEFILCDGM